MTDDAFKVESGKTIVSLTIASVAGRQRIFKLTGHQKKGKQTVFLEAREERKEDLARVARRCFNEGGSRGRHREQQHGYHILCQPNDTECPEENEEEIDDQTSSMDSHEIQCEKKYWNDLRADTGTLFLPGKIVMEQHNLTHTLRVNPGAKRQKSSGFEESAGETNDRDLAKMHEMWIANTNPGRRSTVM